jgi:hypothetical protein
VTGPLQHKIQSVINARDRARRARHPAPASDDQGIEGDQGEQGTPVPGEGDVVRYREDWHFGRGQDVTRPAEPGRFPGALQYGRPPKTSPCPATSDVSGRG